MQSCCGTTTGGGIGGAVLTLGSALGIAAIMMIGRSELTETIGLVMIPGVLGVGTLWTQVRDRSPGVKALMIVGPFVVLFLIGLAAGLVASD